MSHMYFNNGASEHRLVFQNSAELQPAAVSEQVKEVKNPKNNSIENANTTNTLNNLMLGEVGGHAGKAEHDIAGLHGSIRDGQTWAAARREETQKVVDAMKTKKLQQSANTAAETADTLLQGLTLTVAKGTPASEQGPVYKDAQLPQVPAKAPVAPKASEKAPQLVKAEIKEQEKKKVV